MPARCFTPPGTGGFSPESRFRFDPQKAKTLIQDYLDDKWLKSLPKIELKYNTSEGHKKVAEALQGMWKNYLGADIQLLNMEWKVFLQQSKSEILLWHGAGWIGDYIDANTFLHMWRTGDGHNNTGWSNARYDELLELAAKESCKKKDFRTLKNAKNYYPSMPPSFPFILCAWLYQEVHRKGWHPTLLDHHPYKYVRLKNEVITHGKVHLC